MAMVSSAAASRVLQSRPAISKQVRKIAVCCVAGKFDKVQKFHDAMAAAGHISVQLCVASVKRGGGLRHFVFAACEQQVLDWLQNMEDPVVRHVPTPASVVAKMLARRLCKLHDAVALENMQVVKNPNWGQALPAMEFGDLASGFSRYASAQWQVRKRVSDAKTMLLRSDVTDEIKKKAWDLLGVHAVMHC